MMKKLKFYIAGVCLIGSLGSCEKEEVTTVEQDSTSNSPTKEQVKNGYGGSMGQFTIVDNYLYAIDYKTLSVFDLSNANDPMLTESISMPIGMETVFHENGRLFIGANDGVHIYDITNPRSPVELSQFQHVTSCDPVIANSDLALATLRGGTGCGGNLSQLDVIDISSIENPFLVGETTLTNPYGLGFSTVNPDIVYVCDGYDGLKAYDISTPSNPQLVMTNPNVEAMDVIAQNNNQLVVLGRNGIFQFDASNPIELVQKSFIPVE
ncbi:MAG: hypothetical protein WDZ35_09770 [Crocinitomicaceae bacterium]